MTPSEPLIKFLVTLEAFPKSTFNLVASDDDICLKSSVPNTELPVNNNAEAVTCPLPLTLNPELLIKNPVELGEPDIETLKLLSCIEDEPITNPPKNPALAVIVPSNLAPLAINTPCLSTIKLGPILI